MKKIDISLGFAIFKINSKNNFNRIVVSLFCCLALCILLTLCVSWDPSAGMVKFLNFHVGLHNEPKEYALQFAFFDYFLILWIIFPLLLNMKFVLIPINMSYTVSNSLWLRTTLIQPATLILAKIIHITFYFLLVFSLCFLWELVFSAYHKISIEMLYEAGLALSSYTFFSGSLILLFKGKPTDSLEKRQLYILLAATIPLVMYALAKAVSDNFFGLVPFAFPIRANQLNYITLRGNIMAIIISCLILSVVLLRPIIKSTKT